MKYPRCMAALLACLCSACTLHTVQADRQPDFVPASFSNAGEAAAAANWWSGFHAPTLDLLVARALEENRGLAAAWGRLRAAEAAARVSGAASKPTLDATAGVSRSKSLFFDQPRQTTLYNLGISAAYEVDVWHRLRAGKLAALEEVEAAAYDADGVALLVTSSVATTYFTAVEQQLQAELLAAQETVNREFLEIVEARFGNGAAGAADVYQQREALAAVRAQVPQVLRARDLARHQLALLTGQAPGDLSLPATETLPDLPPLPATGLPLDLLQRRPDVRAAQARLTAADHRLGEAVAARYPSLRLTASTGFSSTETGTLFSDWVWSLAGNVLGPIIDGGRRKAEVARRDALLSVQVAQYEETVLTALREVEDALTSEAMHLEQLDRLTVQEGHAEAAYAAGRERYLQGVGSFLTVLTAQQALQRVQRNVLSARVALLGNRIALYKALGTGMQEGAVAENGREEDGETP